MGALADAASASIKRASAQCVAEERASDSAWPNDPRAYGLGPAYPADGSGSRWVHPRHCKPFRKRLTLRRPGVLCLSDEGRPWPPSAFPHYVLELYHGFGTFTNFGFGVGEVCDYAEGCACLPLMTFIAPSKNCRLSPARRLWLPFPHWGKSSGAEPKVCSTHPRRRWWSRLRGPIRSAGSCRPPHLALLLWPRSTSTPFAKPGWAAS